jgi:pyruvate,orthophosphate dikinase
LAQPHGACGGVSNTVGQTGLTSADPFAALPTTAAPQIDAAAKVARVGGVEIEEGAWLSLNGTTGEVLLGRMPTQRPELAGDLAEFMAYADARRVLGVQANADTAEDAAAARKNGAQGIGLVRTEHMFFRTPERIAAVRRMIAAEELDLGDA